jgi:peptide/nickel transport system permease protein
MEHLPVSGAAHGGWRVLKALRRTALQAIPTIAVIVILNFFLLRLAPGDAADVLAGEAGSATVETMAALRRSFGLDLPALDQLLAYLSNLAQFSLGQSPRYNMPVATLIMQRLPNTLVLMLLALGLALAIGIAAGAVMASFVGRWADRVLSVLALLFYSIPGFWVGLMLIVAFSVKLGWLPSGGAETIGSGATGIEAVLDRLRHLILPALSLALFYVAIYARLTRGAMLEVASQDYVRTARAKGLSPFAVTTGHILRNALLPVTTMAGIHLGGMMGGAVVVETVYSWPGLGRLAFEAVMGRDFQVLLGILLFSSLLVVAVNAVIDLVQAWLDPRIEVR